jgi:PAS domain S-box-containing protein
MSTYGYALLGLTGVVATLAAVFVFALLRFMATARSARRQVREGASDSALLSSALQDAFSSLKAREQAMSARAVASEQLSARVFDSLTAGLIVVDATGRVTIANPAACRMLGVPAEPVGGLRDWLGGSPIADLIAQGLSTRRPIERRLVEVRDQDRARHFGATVSPLGDTGSTTGVICLFSDLTTVVELEQQLQMKEALARLGEMTAGIAHEFRNGLATIHGYSRLMDPDSLPDPYRVYVEGIRQETDTLGRVITNFLNFARPEPLSLTPLDLEVVARRAADELRAELPEDTSLIVDGAFGSIQGDDILLRQVFANLIRNAAEA